MQIHDFAQANEPLPAVHQEVNVAPTPISYTMVHDGASTSRLLHFNPAGNARTVDCPKLLRSALPLELRSPNERRDRSSVNQRLRSADCVVRIHAIATEDSY